MSGPRVACRKPLCLPKTHEFALNAAMSYFIFVTYHLLSFRVKDGYFVLARASTGGRYLGNTFSVKISGRMMTNDLPCGNHDTTSENELSASISMSFWGKISRFLLGLGAFNLLTHSSSSLTTDFVWPLDEVDVPTDSTRAVRAVAASTRWESPPALLWCVATAVDMINCTRVFRFMTQRCWILYFVLVETFLAEVQTPKKHVFLNTPF